MKKLLNVFSGLAAFVIVLGAIFKLNHWPGTGAILVLSNGFISLFFFPVLLIARVKDAQGRRAKAQNAFGVFSLMLLNLGVLFKIMHWPLAGPMIVFSMAIPAFYVIPFAGIERARRSRNRAEKIVNITGAFAISLFTLSVLGKLMHWPGPTLLMSVGIVLFTVMIFFFPKAYKDDQEKGKNGLVKLAFLTILATTIILLAFMNSSNTIMYSFALVEESMNDGSSTISANRTVEYETVTANKKEKAMKLRQMTDNLCAYLWDMRSYLIAETEGMTKKEADSVPVFELTQKDNFDIPTHILIGGDPQNPRDGAYSGIELKNRLTVYRTDALSLMDTLNDKKIAEEIGLKLKEGYNPNEQRTMPWEVYKFNATPLAADVLILSQLRSDVLYAESIMLHQLDQTEK
jgi:hypothetical protein